MTTRQCRHPKQPRMWGNRSTAFVVNTTSVSVESPEYVASKRQFHAGAWQARRSARINETPQKGRLAAPSRFSNPCFRLRQRRNLLDMPIPDRSGYAAIVNCLATNRLASDRGVNAIVEENVYEPLLGMTCKPITRSHMHREGPISIQAPHPAFRAGQSEAQRELTGVSHAADTKKVPGELFRRAPPDRQQFSAYMADTSENRVLFSEACDQILQYVTALER